MYKASLDLFKVNKINVKFNVILRDDNKSSLKMKMKPLINKYSIGDTTGFNISPSSYISVDMSKTMDKNDSWDAGSRFNLNKMNLFKFISKLKHMKYVMYKEEKLYYIQDGRLHLNNDIANKYTEHMITSNHTLEFRHCVVYDEENKEQEYEGISIQIMKTGNYVLLSNFEMDYFLYELEHIDMHGLSLKLIITDILMSDNKNELYNQPRNNIQVGFKEHKAFENISVGNPRLVKNDTLPKI